MFSSFLIHRGVEFGDSHSFFSLFGPNWRVKRQVISEERMAGQERTEELVSTTTGTARLAYTFSLKGKAITESAHLTAETRVVLMDFVTRLVFDKDTFPTAYINERLIPHRAENIYHQYETDTAELRGPAGVLYIKMQSTRHQAFKSVLYVRDENACWIVHARLLPQKENLNVVLKLNTRWYNRALPRIIAHPLLSLPFARKALLYRGERTRTWTFTEKLLYALFPLSAYPLATLEPDEALDVSLSCTFVPNEENDK